jgi:L-iditol 2-dehydrogenase
MKVAKLTDINKIEIFEEDKPAPGPGELLIKVKAVGICGSDLHYFLEGGLGTHKENLPMSMGHEPAGIVEDSNGSKWFKNGDRVAIEPGDACLNCYFCLRGLHNLCQNGTFLGAQGFPGAFQEYLLLSERQLVKIPDTMSYEEACLLETMGIGYHALNLINFKLHSSAAVFGVGPIGLSLINTLRRFGAGQIFAIDLLDHRLTYASNHGADFSLKESPEIIDFIKEKTNGLGVDIALDAAGMQHTVNNCFKVTRSGGSIVLVGIPTYDYLEYNPHIARIKELSVFNVRRSNQTLHLCKDIYKPGDLEDMITHKFDLSEIQSAFELAAGYKDNVLKTIITMK